MRRLRAPKGTVTLQSLEALKGVIVISLGQYSILDDPAYFNEMEQMINPVRGHILTEVVEIYDEKTHFICLHRKTLSTDYFQMLELINLEEKE